MRMNRAETLLVNSPLRAVVQRTYETHVLRRLGGRLDGGVALEVGCGRGVGLGIILEQFGADRAVGFDLDRDMVRQARHRLARYGDRVDVSVGDVTAIAAADATYDAVFDFAIVHHVPDWRAAVAEIRRVLRPGGRFYFTEVTRHALQRPTYRLLFDHPEHDRFSGDELIAELESVGLHVGERHVERFFGDFVFGVAALQPR